MPAGLGSDLLHDPRARPGPAVGAVAGHRLERVAGMDDARLNGNSLATEPIRVAAAVPSLMLRSDDRSDPRQEWDRGHDPFADYRMLLHDSHLFVIEGPRLVQDVAGHADLSDVVEQRSVLEEAQHVSREPEALTDRLGERGGLPGVCLGMAVLGVERGGKRGDGGQVALFQLLASLFGHLVLRAQRLAHERRDIRANHHRRREQDHGARVVTVPAPDRQRQGRREDRRNQHDNRRLEFENRRGEDDDHEVEHG